MIDLVVVEAQDNFSTPEAARRAVEEAMKPSGVEKVVLGGDDILVYLSDSRDPEREVIERLTDAGIDAVVYLNNGRLNN